MSYLIGQMDTKLGQIKRVFYEHPVEEFHIREIARLLGITKTTVAYHVNSLLKQEIILSRKHVFKTYYANESSKVYRFDKLIDSQITP
jgi:DNA-binding MarR family transcriptional regulator